MIFIVKQEGRKQFLNDRGRSTAGTGSPRPVVIGRHVWLLALSTHRRPHDLQAHRQQCVVHDWLCVYTDICLSVLNHCLLSLSLCIREQSPRPSDLSACQFRTHRLLVCVLSQTPARPGPWGSFWSGSC